MYFLVSINSVHLFLTYFHRFETPLAVSAPRNDLELYGLLIKYKDYDSRKAWVLMKQMRRQMWFLTEQAVTLALFDTKLPDEEREELARSLLAVKNDDKEIPMGSGRPKDIDNLTWPGERPKMNTFVGEASWLLFKLANVNGTHEWMKIPCKHWAQFEEYNTLEVFARNLTVTNDSAGNNTVSIV